VLLMRHVGQLKSSFQSMDKLMLKDGAHAISKFDVSKMEAGTILDFFN
jgi:hypothetical protein